MYATVSILLVCKDRGKATSTEIAKFNRQYNLSTTLLFGTVFPKGSFVPKLSLRRRLGKSTLIEEFARRAKSRILQLEGIAAQKGMTNAGQLKTFCWQLG